MKWNRLCSNFVIPGVIGLVLSATQVYAQQPPPDDIIPPPDDNKAKQKFDLAPKAKGKSFIDFGKLGKLGVGPVKFEAKKKNGKKKPAAIFDFGAPMLDPAGGGHQVSVELVALSLVSAEPIPLNPFFDNFIGEGKLTLSLGGMKKKSKQPVKLDPNAEDKKRQGKKGKGKFDLKVKKDKLKVSAKKNGVKKEKKLPKKKLKALDVGFAFASPIMITDAAFCLEDGNNAASICLAPIPNPIPLPGTLALMAPALSLLLLGQFVRRRRSTAAA